MSSELKLEMKSYSIRCEHCKMHKPLYKDPENNKQVCRKCLISSNHIKKSKEEKPKGKLVPTLLGKIVHRHHLDPVTANILVEYIANVRPMESTIQNIENFLYEARLYLIANDDSEEVFRRTDYQIQDEEYHLIQEYVIDADIEKDPPKLSKVLEMKEKTFSVEIQEQLKRVKEILEAIKS